ncbi:MAG TPA: hypothetical protein VFM74_03170 [Candidatus Limnocylindria bacterium]|nr:hypothetical protein [Candidatus Limnocylindria bacterium]
MAGSHGEEAGIALHRTLLDGLGPDAPRQLALAQARLAWREVVTAAGLEQATLSSRLVDVNDQGVARVEASESILAQELTLRGEALVWAVNRQMAGRPGATIELRSLAVSAGRSGERRHL